MTKEELITIREAETWCEVQEEIDKLFAEHESEIIADGWDSVDDFIDNGNWEIFVENIIDSELKRNEYESVWESFLGQGLNHDAE